MGERGRTMRKGGKRGLMKLPVSTFDRKAMLDWGFQARTGFETLYILDLFFLLLHVPWIESCLSVSLSIIFWSNGSLPSCLIARSLAVVNAPSILRPYTVFPVSSHVVRVMSSNVLPVVVPDAAGFASRKKLARETLRTEFAT
ncbi:hypothetical protein P280DRAFT_306475 [Massarina eburnea CBS 473.64]|uniref:Uncharacterized protein n=1 Tax=Massarina eburnea CBS 473.64 TaxID=1395130 RepID=A0A6A6S2D5_9PLEO|nr:hypothetical protein P280DRAFT_306475 [Massarina eburnea CBS 473.64]